MHQNIPQLISIKSKQTKTTSQQIANLCPENKTKARRSSEKLSEANAGIYVGIQPTEYQGSDKDNFQLLPGPWVTTYFAFLLPEGSVPVTPLSHKQESYAKN